MKLRRSGLTSLLYRFIKWLDNSIKFLGSARLDHFRFIMQTFDLSLAQSLKKYGRLDESLKALRAFFADLQNEWGAIQAGKLDRTSEKVNVVILYRLVCGSGHLSAAVGIKEYLTQKGYQVHLLEGGSPDDLEYHSYSKGHFRYRVNNMMQNMRHKVIALQPHLLINTTVHHNSWGQLAYDLSTPMIAVHTDYELSDAVYKFDGVCKLPLNKDDPDLVTYGLTDDENYHEWFKETLRKEIYDGLIKPLGFPIGPMFRREADSSTIAELRVIYQIGLDRRVVLILGNNEAEGTAMNHIIHQLLTAQLQYPFCIVAVCGDNEEIQSVVRATINRYPQNNNVTIQLKEKLSPQEMADYMKMASRIAPLPGVMISKTGGSTIAEALEMGVFTLALDILAHELCNRKHIIRKGMGELLDLNIPIPQLERVISWTGKPEEVYKPTLNWRKNLKQMVREKISKHGIKI